MSKSLKRSVIFTLTLFMVTSTIFAKPEFHIQYDDLKTVYNSGEWMSYRGNYSPTGLSIKISKNRNEYNTIDLGNVGERNMNGSIGLVQRFNIFNEDKNGKRTWKGFQEESFKVDNRTLFYTTKDINKAIIPTVKYLKPKTHVIKDVVTFDGYTMDMKDAQKMVEEYAKTNEIAHYYYKSMDIMKYEGEYDSNGERSGFGRMYNLDGDLIYIGMWDSGVFNGFGITFRDGEASYVGEWYGGMPIGMGRVRLNNEKDIYTDKYFYYDYSGNVKSDYITKKYEKLQGMEVPFDVKPRVVYTIDNLNEDKLKKIIDSYDIKFKEWSDKKINEIRDFKENPPYKNNDKYLG